MHPPLLILKRSALKAPLGEITEINTDKCNVQTNTGSKPLIRISRRRRESTRRRRVLTREEEEDSGREEEEDSDPEEEEGNGLEEEEDSDLEEEAGTWELCIMDST